MSAALFEEMKKRDTKSIAFIGFSDAYGEAWLKDVEKRAEASGIKLVAVERYARTDQSVTAQALKLVGQKPDAIFIAASGTRQRCPCAPCASAVSRASSTRPTAPPTTTSCVSPATPMKA
jgi:branched-chain amino acid transport system substrate-binding protein